MKKVQNLLLLVIFMVCAFTFNLKVDAATPTFQSITVKQGDTVLTKEGNTYIANGYDNLYFTYEIPYSSHSSYYIEMYEDEYNEDNYIGGGYYYPDFVSTVWLSLPSMENSIKTYLLKLCDDWGCPTTYDSASIVVNFTKVGTFDDDVVYYTKIMQAGSEVLYNNEIGGFSFNNLQDVTFTVHAENLDPTATYELICADKSMKYTGSQLMNDVDHTCIISGYQNSNLNISYGITRSSWGLGI